MRRQQLIIFMLVGIMAFSVVASGLALLANNGAQNDQANLDGDQQQRTCQTSPEVAQLAGNPEGEWPAQAEGDVRELQIIDLRQGDSAGEVAEIGSCITVHYRLSLADGTPVAGNNTFEAQSGPLSFELTPGSLIDAWVEGVPGMREGGFRRLIVPAELAYGETERNGIPPNSDLIFDIELVEVQN